MDFTVIVVIIIIAGIFGALSESADSNKRKEIIDSTLKSLPDFDVTQYVVNSYGLDSDAVFTVHPVSIIAIDETRKMICLISITFPYKKSNPSDISTRIVSYKDILSVELFEGGTSITKTVRSSQIGGAVIGGLLLGGTGAIIGGLSGKTETTKKGNYITLQLLLNDINNPLCGIDFLRGNEKPFDSVYKGWLQQARHWHGVIEVIIKRADEEEKQQAIEQQKSVALPNISIADEIKKLTELHTSGLLTLEEFQQQKTKLLGNIDIPKTVEPEQINSTVLPQLDKPQTKISDNPICPKCAVPMQIKTASKGVHQGKQFYVCSNYPSCKEISKADNA